MYGTPLHSTVEGSVLAPLLGSSLSGLALLLSFLSLPEVWDNKPKRTLQTVKLFTRSINYFDHKAILLLYRLPKFKMTCCPHNYRNLNDHIHVRHFKVLVLQVNSTMPNSQAWLSSLAPMPTFTNQHLQIDNLPHSPFLLCSLETKYHVAKAGFEFNT